MSLPVWKNKWDTLCHKASPPPNPLTEGLTPARSAARCEPREHKRPRARSGAWKPRLRRLPGSLAECHDAHQHSAYAGRFQRDEEQAAEAVSRGARARGPGGYDGQGWRQASQKSLTKRAR
jgi:hypothetical protein